MLPAVPPHFEFWLDILKVANDNGHDTAIFFLRYTQTPFNVYPTQLRQAVEALRYILNETDRSPSNVIVGGDSAGGNLAMAVLLHLSHPHPEIESISLSTPLAGVFGIAPWVNFSTDWPSFKENAYKDLLTARVLDEWSATYHGGQEHDSWSEPDRAPAEWWADAKTERILLLAGSDELLLSPIESFAKKVKVCTSLDFYALWRYSDNLLVFSPSFLALHMLLALMSLTMQSFMAALGRKEHRLAMNCDSGSFLVCRQRDNVT